MMTPEPVLKHRSSRSNTFSITTEEANLASSSNSSGCRAPARPAGALGGTVTVGCSLGGRVTVGFALGGLGAAGLAAREGGDAADLCRSGRWMRSMEMTTLPSPEGSPPPQGGVSPSTRRDRLSSSGSVTPASPSGLM